MNHWDTVAIVGVGLIGGSIGIDLRSAKAVRRVVGVGRRAETLEAAVAAGCVDETTLDLRQAAAAAELIIVCTPVGRIVDDVRIAASAARPGTLVTDAGSTKASIVRALAGTLPAEVAFVGSHPIAGSEKSGPTAAVAGLFRDRVAVVTPLEDTPPTNVERTKRLWQLLGARTIEMSPEAHDAALAATSHVPHLVASALAGITPVDMLPLAAGGWHDTTRIAASDAALWSQILVDNRECVSAVLGKFEVNLSAFRRAIESGDLPEIERLWNLGRERRAAAEKARRK